MSINIQVSAKIISWPSICACCGEQANASFRAKAVRTTGKRVKHTTTKAWDVPYCEQCLDHKRKSDAAA